MNRKKINIILKSIYSRNWKNVFNEIDDIYTDKVLNIASDFEIYRQKQFEQNILKGYSLNSEISSIKNEITGEQLLEYAYRNNKLVKEYNKLLDKINTQLYKMCEKINKFDDEIEDIVIPYTRYISDGEELFIRLGVLKAKFFNMLVSFDFNQIGEDNTIFKENAKILRELKQVVLNGFEENRKELEKDIANTVVYKKIFDYKEMNKLAEENDYKFARFNGDHKVYIHNKTNKIVVIPQHSLKYGLMYNIQKQIKNNSIK